MKKSKTLAQVMSENILAMIQENNYVPGDKLPTESELCEQFGAGRNTIREALKILASKNIITIRQGAGSFVSERQGISDDPLGFAMISDRQQLTTDLFQVLIILEPSIAGLAAENATEEDIRQLEEIVIEIEDSIRKKRNYSKLDAKFHCKVAECAHNIVMKNLTPVIESGIIFYSQEFDRSNFGTRFHRTLFEYIRDHRSVDASSEMRYHLLFDKHHYRQENPSAW
ncbi:MAG: FadR/GntR family transcriptional regulator [Candidatus Onthomonas sp.]